MKSIFAALAMFLLVSISTAEYVAHYSADSLRLDAGSATIEKYNGSFGNYAVETGFDSYGAYVKIAGENESAQALSLEIAALVAKGSLSTACDNEKMAAAAKESAGNYLFCNKETWFACQAQDCGNAVPQKAPDALPPAIEGIFPAATASKQAADSRNMPSGQAEAGPLGQGALGGAQDASQAPATTAIGMDQLLQLFAVFLAVIMASYLIIQQRPAQQADHEVERLLSNGTRAGIMEELSVADKIPTDLSMRLGKSKATVVEHLDALVVAGLVERLETPGRKFVYYRLTQKGKQALLRRAAS